MSSPLVSTAFPVSNVLEESSERVIIIVLSPLVVEGSELRPLVGDEVTADSLLLCLRSSQVTTDRQGSNSARLTSRVISS